MPTKLSPSAAIKRAKARFDLWVSQPPVKALFDAFETDAKNGFKPKVRNDGTSPPDTNDGTKDFITADDSATAKSSWDGGTYRGLKMSASDSSGGKSINLKLKYPGSNDACFNFHIPFGIDPAIAIKDAQVKAQAAAQKKLADERDKKEAAAKLVKEAAAEAEKKKAKEAQAREKKLSDAANAAYNKLSDKDKAGIKGSSAIDAWKKKWIKENASRVK